MDLEIIQNKAEKGNDIIPSKRSSKNTLAEAIATRDRRIKESKLGFRTLNAMASSLQSFSERERERELGKEKRNGEVGGTKWEALGTI